MRIRIEPRENTLILRAIRAQREQEAERAPGLHCSTIVNDIANRISPPDRDGIDEATGLTFQEIGNAVEDVCASALAARFPGWEKPEPRRYRGIWCSPDGDSPRIGIIDEVKAKWAHCREFMDVDGQVVRFEDGQGQWGELTRESAAFQKYRMQVLFYMAAWGYEVGRLHVLFLTGTGRPPFPLPTTIWLRPTPEEIEENADMIVQHAEDEFGLRPGGWNRSR